MAVEGGIPEARARLSRLATALRTRGHIAYAIVIEDIVNQFMFRKSPIRRARKKLPKLTPELADAIRTAAEAYPNMSQLELANLFGTNPGRVSEALNHKV